MSPKWAKHPSGCLNQQSETMKRFKTYEETYCGIKWFLRYMGKEVEGQCKWYIWSDDINFYEYNDTLWYSADEARYVARYIISNNKINQKNLDLK